MAYSTGSGSYTDLMAAVLAHAIADGWTTSGGNWPISKGKVRGVDWQSTTRSVSDYSTGSPIALTERIIRLAIGTSMANATANAASLTTSVLIACMNFSIVDWHIFSDPGVGKPDYIHVVTRYSNALFSDIFNHFSFGEIDKGGMTHGGAVFVASHARRGYPALAAGPGTATWQSYDWNCGDCPNWNMHFGGSAGRGGSNRQSAGSENNLLIILDPSPSVTPATGGWLQPDTLGAYSNILDVMARDYGAVVTYANLMTSGLSVGMVSQPAVMAAQPYSGGVTMQSIPLILISSVNSAMFIGVIPGVRICTMQSFNPRDEITYASDTWKLMPLLRKTPPEQLLQSLIVSSAEVGYAYKKVA